MKRTAENERGRARISLARYLSIRQAVIGAGWIDDINWSEGLSAPKTAEELASEAIFVICNSGMAWTVGRAIFDRMIPALAAGESAITILRHPHKAKSIDKIWKDRARLFDEFIALATDAGRLSWCERLPHVGGITKYHLAKNLGVDVAKPDRHLQRLADASGESVQGLCARLSREHGDRVATVDVVLWRACACGIINSNKAAEAPCL